MAPAFLAAYAAPLVYVPGFQERKKQSQILVSCLVIQTNLHPLMKLLIPVEHSFSMHQLWPSKNCELYTNPIVLRVSSFPIKALKSRVERQSDVRYMFVSQLNSCYFPGFYRLERYKGATNLRNFTNFRTKLGLFFPTSNGFGPGQPDNEGLNTEHHAPQGF